MQWLRAPVLAAVAALLPCAPAAAAPRPFAPTSFWNAPLRADAPLDPASPRYAAELAQQVRTYGPWINTTKFSSPVYTVGAHEQTVRVTLDKRDPGLQAAWERVPIPRGARPAAGTDHTMVIWQPATDTMWELWVARRAADGWHARWGGRMEHVSASPGYYTDPPRWGATGTSLPALGGMMRLDELRANRIDHALAIALPEVRAAVYSWPAQRTDGSIAGAGAIPAGMRFRLDPSLNLARLRLSPIVRAMARAAQRYGIVVRDRAGAVAFYAEDPTPTGGDPYGRLFGGRYPSALLAQFPWAHLQALRPDLRVDPF